MPRWIEQEAALPKQKREALTEKWGCLLGGLNQKVDVTSMYVFYLQIWDAPKQCSQDFRGLSQ